MAAKKPLVLDANGVQTELQSGDTVYGTLLKVPFYLADGTDAAIPLNSNNELPFLLANGTAANIPVVIV